MLDEIRAAGVTLEIVNELPNWPSSAYAHTLPILMRHLHRPYSQGTLAALARSMGMKEAAPYWDELIALRRRSPNPEFAELVEELRHDPVFARGIQRWKGIGKVPH